MLDAEDHLAKDHKHFEKWVSDRKNPKQGAGADKVDRSGWEQSRLFKGRRVAPVAYILQKSTRDHHTAYERHLSNGIVVEIKQKGAAPAEIPPGKPVKAPNGSYDFGEIPLDIAAQIGKPAAKIRLLHGEHSGLHKGTGLKHIKAEHGHQIKAAGFPSPEEFVHYVTTNYNAIYKGKKGRIALVVEGPPQRVAIVEVRKNKKGGFYSVCTAYPPKGIKFTGTALWKGRQP